MRRGSVSSELVVGLRVVKRVWGASSVAVLMRVAVLLVLEDWKEGRVMVKVSVVGWKARIVLWEGSGGWEVSWCWCVFWLGGLFGMGGFCFLGLTS